MGQPSFLKEMDPKTLSLFGSSCFQQSEQPETPEKGYLGPFLILCVPRLFLFKVTVPRAVDRPWQISILCDAFGGAGLT
jgi:hypothetical protein